jgi:hypothetical protein
VFSLTPLISNFNISLFLDKPLSHAFSYLWRLLFMRSYSLALSFFILTSDVYNDMQLPLTEILMCSRSSESSGKQRVINLGSFP